MKEKTKQFVVLGMGRFGMSLARTLCEMGHQVLAVDSDPACVEEITPFVTRAVQADATDENVIRELGVGNFDAAIVAIGQSVSDSVLVSLLCKESGSPRVLAKAIDDLHAKVLTKVGVDRVIFPERDMGARVAKSLVSPNVLELMELAGDYTVVETALPAGWAGKTLQEIDVRRRFGVSVLAIHRAREFIVSPMGDSRVEREDQLLVLGHKEDIARLEA